VTTTETLAGKRILIVGGARAIGAELARRAAAVDAVVIVGARDGAEAAGFAQTLPRGRAVRIDVLDEATIAAAAQQIGEIDHVVSLASAHHDVPVVDLDRDKAVAAFGTKVFGPLLLAKHFAPRVGADGSFLFFAGIVGWKPKPGTAVKGIANGALGFVASHLSVELAPIRVNVISPGIVDSGTWDGLGDERKDQLLARATQGSLVARHGHLSDIADATLWLLGAGYVTGEVVHVEGGTRLRSA
jgi:NAD(P)-dependent dehydrogenase (short-subunit alcohol dehydrogenase family)